MTDVVPTPPELGLDGNSDLGQDDRGGLFSKDDFEEGLEEGLLQNNNQTRLNHATAALSATIVGAGIVALPRAFASLGLVLGSILTLCIFGLSSYTLSAMIRSATSAGCWTYDELVRSQFGRIGGLSLDVSIVLNNAGGMVIFLIIMGDVLVGAPPHYSGIVTNLFGIHSGDVWWVSRPFVMAVVCACVLCPLVSLKNIRMLGPMSSVAVMVAASLVLSIVLLSVDAGFEGKLGDYNWFPNMNMLGDSLSEIITSLISILPVISMGFVCHYNLFPVANNLERFTERRIAMVIRRALALCTMLFLSLAISGVLLFGSHTEANILLNLRPEVVEEYISPNAASLLCLSIRVAYCMCLMSSFTMLNWALRETLTVNIFGVRMLHDWKFYAKSYSIIWVEYLISILFPNIWTVMSLTGATAAVYVSYILPGALVWSVHGDGKIDFALGGFCVALGILMSIFGVAKTLFLS